MAPPPAPNVNVPRHAVHRPPHQRRPPQGYGVQQSHARAAELYEQASAGGSAYGPALASLGLLYASGLGVARNYTKAVQYLGEASDQGVASAQYNLATVLRQGLGGVPIDKERGVRLLEKVRSWGRTGG